MFLTGTKWERETDLSKFAKLRNYVLCSASGPGLLLSSTVASHASRLQDFYPPLPGEWWQWAEATGAPAAPSGPTDCHAGQDGYEWFFAGTFGTTEVRDRTRPIPRVKYLFFPLVIVEVSNNDCAEFAGPGQRRHFESSKAFRQQLMEEVYSASKQGPLEDFLSGPGVNSYACQLHVSIDGEPAIFTSMLIVRVQSGLFKLADDDRAVADGYFVLLPPQGIGHHTVCFGGGFCDATQTATNPPPSQWMSPTITRYSSPTTWAVLWGASAPHSHVDAAEACISIKMRVTSGRRCLMACSSSVTPASIADDSI